MGLVALLLTVVAPIAPAGQSYRDLLGLCPGMSEPDVHARLEKLGKRMGGESEEGEGRRESWLLRDRRFASVTVEFDPELTLEWATAFARLHGKRSRVRFTDVGDLQRARRIGNYIYTWPLPLERASRKVEITARGSDSIWVSSVSIHRSRR